MSYSPQTWSNTPGATPINATRLGHMEDGIEDASARLDVVEPNVANLQDSVSALQSALGGGGAGASLLAGGASAARPSPLLHAVYIDDGLVYPIWSDGSSWKKFSDNSVIAGGTNAPRNVAATVNPDNSVAVTWDAPLSVTVTSYKLYDSRNTSGVPGQSAITGTTTTYTPSVLTGSTDVWVTATVSGVEGAASNHATFSEPYSGSSFTGSPAQLLNFGSGGGFWSLDIGYDTGDVSYDYSTLTGGYSNFPYFCLNSTSTAVQFYVDMAGKTTSSGTHYARCELRELKSDGVTHAAWTASTSSTSHIMEYTFKLTHIQPLKPWVTIGQIHDSSSDALSIKVKGSSTSSLQIVATIYDTDQTPLIASSYSVGDTVTIRIELINGTLKIYCNGVLKLTSTALSGKSSLYFKVGDYPQSHDDWGGFESPTEYCQVELHNLSVSHSPSI